ncbi:PREDICTED: histone-lysine N-methyltransferase SUVR5 isoform X2 [Tarenaya hassleriana]|uniref:histone-lysine N-methyltransferase SUVR5 isoform X2 n=1 Tax=Tarenaya hassleriana TaxID=28532 RepID=UPI00053C3E84|nr:PREDICTED: histone-lysine N-methyltransferase SUVR5 isoform X2 [Tarenaya hassleriana]
MEVLPCSSSQPTEQVENSAVGMDEFIVTTMDDFPVQQLDDRVGTGNNGGSSLNSPCSNANLLDDTTETELLLGNNGEEESSPSASEPKWLQQDDPIALWVKWRGIWQAGIRCSRADWPLATLRGKPTHDRKKYFVIFFPHTKNYSWADMQLVRSIEEFPEPIAYKSHRVGLKMVKDLTAARRYIMRKLAVGILNIVDQFYSEVVVEAARDVTIWKELAMEASQGAGYHDLGRMLLKLQSMILQRYMNPVWLENSFPSWVRKCNDAANAESVELLKEELDNSILWNEVKSTVDAPMQLMLLSEWKTWKHEITKWFSISPLGGNVGEIDMQNSEGLFNQDLQATRKRPKLEIRRAETHTSQEGTAVGIDSEFFTRRDSTITDDVMKEAPLLDEDAVMMNTPKNGLDQWDSIVVEAAPPGSQLVNEANGSGSKKPFGSGNKSQQCIAFIESKGRQCVRWANEGDVYCCVHLASRFTTKPINSEISPAVETPMCGGVTVLGTKCKHRSLPGSSFCKKHRPHTGMEKPAYSYAQPTKRKLDEIMSIPKTTHCLEIVPFGEVPLQGGASFEENLSNEGTSFGEMLEHCSNDDGRCVGSCSESRYIPCHESSARHTLYCDQHLPNWLKRARNGKSRIISKEVFLELLRVCSSRKEKLCLHQACDLFYKLFKSVLSLRNTVPMDVQLQWAISEAARYDGVGEFLLKLVSREKERLIRIWGFTAAEEDPTLSSSFAKAESATTLLATAGLCDGDNRETKEQEKWSFRGFACAICLDSFVDRKLLETHVEERHHVQFAEKCMLLQCIPCGSHFGDSEQLLFHLQAVHPSMCKLPEIVPQEKPLIEPESSRIPETANTYSTLNQKRETLSGVQKFVCKFCGMKFDLLPDLGRHHQAEHMGSNVLNSRGPKRGGVKFNAYRMKSGRLSRPNRFKKGLGVSSYRIRNRVNVNMKRRMQVSKSLGSEGLTGISPATDAGTLGRLTDSHCSVVAKILFSKIQKTKPRPNNVDILSAARSACCRLSLKASLEAKFGILPELICLKAAKLCSENGIQVQWHQEGYVCPNGCKHFKDPNLIPPLVPRQDNDGFRQAVDSREYVNDGLEVDECHCIMESHHFSKRRPRKATVLCNDISFGQESVNVACAVDDDDDGRMNEKRPWESFTYITKPMLNQSMNLENENLQLGCSCRSSACSPETCDHVYLFDNDFEDAKDIRGRSMRGRLPYDDRGRIILEEGYPVYECNDQCGCSRTCRNRVLQNGIRIKLEIFRTEKKGWGVRACEPILHGTFICEYVGEVIDLQEANKRESRYGKEGCGYMRNINANINDIGRLIEVEEDYVIDATKYGNVSRFINHSCSPNLVTHQVLVESMESPLSHIGLYANADIAEGEELTWDYGQKLSLSEQGHPCHCGASNCRRGPVFC